MCIGEAGLFFEMGGGGFRTISVSGIFFRANIFFLGGGEIYTLLTRF